MAAVRKFLFETAFDEVPEPEPFAPEPAAADPAPTPAPEPEPEPTFSEADLEAARAEGYAAGLEAGRAENAQQIEQATRQALETLAQGIADLFARQAEAQRQLADDGMAVAAAVVRKLFPELIRRDGMAEIEAIVGESLARMAEEPKITVRVAAGLRDALASRIEGMAASAGFDGRLAVLADPAIPEGDVRVAWAEGGAERDAAALWQAIDDIVERHLGGRPQAADAEPTGGR